MYLNDAAREKKRQQQIYKETLDKQRQIYQELNTTNRMNRKEKRINFEDLQVFSPYENSLIPLQ